MGISKEAKFLISKFNLQPYLSTTRISFFYQSNPKVYLIVFNSTRKNQILSKQMIKRFCNAGFMQGIKKLENFSPPVDITSFSGNLQGNISFICLDMAYMQIGGIKFLESANPTKDIIKFYNIDFD